VKLTRREASNINKNIIKNVISVHLNKRTATGRRRTPQLGAGQYYAGAGATPLVSNPGPQTFSGYSDSFYGLQRQEQTASNIAAVIKREGDQANDSGNGGQPKNNMTPSKPGVVQNVRSQIMTPNNKSGPPELQTSSANKPLTPVKIKQLTPVKIKPLTPVKIKQLTPVPSDLGPRNRPLTEAGENAKQALLIKKQITESRLANKSKI
jgi:hypothetical protein